MLKMKYERKNFFGRYTYAEDAIDNPEKEDIKKAFLFLSRNRESAIEEDHVIYFWENINAFDNRILTVRNFHTTYCGYEDVQKSFDAVKKEVYKRYSWKV